MPEIVEHKGYRILFTDYSNMNEDTDAARDRALAAIKENLAALDAWEEPYLLTMYDVTGMHFKNTLRDAFKQISVRVNQMGISLGAASIGVVGAKRILGKILKPDMYFAKNRDDAMEWLANRGAAAQQQDAQNG